MPLLRKGEDCIDWFSGSEDDSACTSVFDRVSD